jgi:hypothetical protein
MFMTFVPSLSELCAGWVAPLRGNGIEDEEAEMEKFTTRFLFY